MRTLLQIFQDTKEVLCRLKIVGFIFRLNKKFGMHHTVDILNDRETLFRKCAN